MIVEAVDDVTGAMTVQLSGIIQSMHNFLRHALFKDVPTLGVDTVTFIQYDGPLESEMVSHRLGQLPVRVLHTAPLDTTAATFCINVVAPPRTEKSGITWVTSADVVCTSENAEVVSYRSAAEREIAARDTGYLLVPLHPGERVHVTFTARVSTGREAARWVSCFIKPSLSPFRLYIETTGAVTPREALHRALQTSIKHLRALAADLDA